MAARLQGDIGRRALGLIARQQQGLLFRMGPPALAGGRLGDDLAVLDQHAADRGIGPGLAQAVAGQVHGPPHHELIGRLAHAAREGSAGRTVARFSSR